ncbi:hypothetical protein QCE73_26745 [Caballeronia sp. LZ029]|uniref:hypothetical protein n=1 Tax=Caballeronia sp. LZ029 TaxID=3038564 RepID=UPI00285F9314|nr:hypothetical protein [Caballeronia sp. LZ029]MDR5746775.1 hypothetical protein [Caballeronia sp. LZ029]
MSALTTPTLAGAQAPGCALQAPNPLNLDVVKPLFRQHFCVGMADARCERRWSNINPLMTKLSTDPKVPTVGTAAFMLATTFVETGIKDFDPGTVEILKSPPPNYAPDWLGRGWVQLTYKDKYALVGQALNLDLVGHPNLALEPDNSYRILVWAVMNGALENYRRTPGGGCDANKRCYPPIKLGDFVNSTKADYGRARAVINANCSKPKGQSCTDVMYQGKGYIPPVERIDAATLNARVAGQFEEMLCKGMGL